MKTLDLKIFSILNREEQLKIVGREGGSLCEEPNTFYCEVPNHVCCRGMCVLPTHPACSGV